MIPPELMAASSGYILTARELIKCLRDYADDECPADIAAVLSQAADRLDRLVDYGDLAPIDLKKAFEIQRDLRQIAEGR